MRRLSVLAASVIVLGGGCAGTGPAPTLGTTPTAIVTASPGPTAPPLPTGTARPACQNPEGHWCLNELPAGTYTTELFMPTLTYTVPEGWANHEDLRGNFLLVPPGGDLPGVNADTSDFVGVYTSVAAPNGCDEGTAPSVGFSPADLKAYYEGHPGLEVTSTPASVGGLTGYRLEVRMKDSWKTPCSYSSGHPIVPMLIGRAPSGLDHNIGAGRAWHLYLLGHAGGSLAVEVVDVHGGSHLAEYDTVIARFLFAPVG